MSGPHDATRPRGDEATILRTWLEGASIGPDGRLPPERNLAPLLGLSRLELRRGLSALEEEGLLNRHVGRGTFLTRPPAAPSRVERPSLSPDAIVRARLVLEPAIASLAALNATSNQIDLMIEAAGHARLAESWAVVDNANERFHRVLTEAAGNALLTQWNEAIAEAVAATHWGRLRDRTDGPKAADPANEAHVAIVYAISHRDRKAAAFAARHHVLSEGAFVGEDFALPSLAPPASRLG